MKTTEIQQLAKKPSSASVKANIRCVKYDVVSANDTYTKNIGISIDANGQIIVYDSNYNQSTSTSAFKTAMNGVYLVYELATPTTETVSNPELRGVLKLDANNKLYYYGDTMSDIPNPQLVYSDGTEEYIDAGVEAGTRDVAIPVGQDSEYVNGDIYISYGTSPIDLAKEHSIVPYATTYIDSNGTEDIEYWDTED